VNVALLLCCVRLILVKYMLHEPAVAQDPAATDEPQAGLAGGGTAAAGGSVQLAAVLHPNQEARTVSDRQCPVTSQN
jgi:hypothetical protein